MIRCALACIFGEKPLLVSNMWSHDLCFFDSLTDEQTRENWEKYGHPDGKRAIEFGIALPAWMVGNEYKWLVCLVLQFSAK